MSFYNVLSDSEKLTMGPIVISKKTIGLFAFDGFSANDMLHFSRFRAFFFFFFFSYRLLGELDGAVSIPIV